MRRIMLTAAALAASVRPDVVLAGWDQGDVESAIALAEALDQQSVKFRTRADHRPLDCGWPIELQGLSVHRSDIATRFSHDHVARRHVPIVLGASTIAASNRPDATSDIR